jgi:anti-sigma regulatory factor (Ser/Thr protein kinase)
MVEATGRPALARRRFAAAPEASDGARRWAVSHLAAHGLAAEVKDDVALVLGELVANVVTHAGVPCFDVTVSVGEHVTVVVTDDATTRPVLRRATADGESGRGIRIVQALSESWGSTSTVRGKAVWAHIGLGARRAARRRRGQRGA